MSGFLDQFRKRVVYSAWKEDSVSSEPQNVDDKIALGVLLWVVAEADKKFLPEEEDKIRDVLSRYSKISTEDLPLVLASVQEASRERIDLYRFTHEVSQDLSRDIKIAIIDDLFRVACADKDLDDSELEIIRKISNLFNLSHKEFIDSKIRIKKEFGLDTATF